MKVIKSVFYGSALSLAAFYGCTEGCEFSELNFSSLVNGENVVEIRGTICPDEDLQIEVNQNFIVLPILLEAASLQGIEPYEAFEKGETYYEGMRTISESSSHIIEIRNRATLANNLNNPYTDAQNTLFERTAPNINITTNFNLDGHPLLLMLALENIDDVGGAKEWITSSAVWPNGDEITELGSWSCILDNSYTFMKGSRFKYDPNKNDNAGFLCNKEKEYFTNPNSVTQVYGTYSVVVDGDNIFLRTSINTSPTESYTNDFKIISYTWDEIKIEVENDNGEQAYAILIPANYPDNI